MEPGAGGAAAASTLLAALHARYPAAPAEAENVPEESAAARPLAELGYALAFARQEMALRLEG